MCSFPALPAPDDLAHMLVRTDDNGRSFLVEDGLTPEAAGEICLTMTRRGHKQHFSVVSYSKAERGQVLSSLGITP